MNKFFLNGPEDYKLMSQTGVRQFVFPLEFSHNAIWDSNVSPEGKLYFGLASEIFTGNYVRLCEYDYENNDIKTLFKVEDVILPSDRTIRASKFHTSISFMNDQRMIMTTHTTDKSPAHPTWMPDAYYNHMWEGFPGSNIVIYDPATGQASNMGIPVPRESIYGAVYEPGHNCLFFTGFFKGHLYRYSIDEKTVLDLGKVSENYAFRLVIGPDGHCYGASRSGYVYKVNTDTLKITDMNYRLPYYNFNYPREFRNISVGRIGPDNRLYFAVMFGRDILALDTITGQFENMGAYIPTENYIKGENRNGIFGMDFDSNGVLWYALSSKNDTADKPETGLPGSLFRWDITRGKKPEWAGLLGTKHRVGAWMSELCITKDDILYAVGSNHSLDGPDITAIDLKKFEPDMQSMSNEILDEFYNPAAPQYIASSKKLFDLERMGEGNPISFDKIPAAPPVLLWRELAPDNIEQSGVTGLYWDKNNTLYGVCGKDKKFIFEIKGLKLQSIKPTNECSPDYINRHMEKMEPVPSQLKTSFKLPSYPGRQYKAVPAIHMDFSKDRKIVGTKDGMLAILSEEGIFSLGPVSPNGPIHAMSVNPDKTILYGVAGDPDDMGSVFTYDDKNGLLWKGFVNYESPGSVGVVCCTNLSCCSVSKDGHYLAIASNERLGTVIIYRLP